VPDLSAYRFTKSHEWAKAEGDLTAVGISEYAQSQLGDVIYLEFPDVGTRLEAAGRFGVIESVKAASDLYSPVAGEVAEVNAELKDHPEYVNQDPYGKGWILKLRSAGKTDSLMDSGAYEKFVQSEG
jgi:glycine cleavage system H protein